MMTIKERLVAIETELKLVKKLLYGIFMFIAASTGIQII